IAGSAETEEGPAPAPAARRRGAATANLAELNDELGRLLVLLNGADEAPTTQQQAGVAELARRLDGALAGWAELRGRELERLDRGRRRQRPTPPRWRCSRPPLPRGERDPLRRSPRWWPRLRTGSP